MAPLAPPVHTALMWHMRGSVNWQIAFGSGWLYSSFFSAALVKFLIHRPFFFRREKYWKKNILLSPQSGDFLQSFFVLPRRLSPVVSRTLNFPVRHGRFTMPWWFAMISHGPCVKKEIHMRRFNIEKGSCCCALKFTVVWSGWLMARWQGRRQKCPVLMPISVQSCAGAKVQSVIYSAFETGEFFSSDVSIDEDKEVRCTIWTNTADWRDCHRELFFAHAIFRNSSDPACCTANNTLFRRSVFERYFYYCCVWIRNFHRQISCKWSSSFGLPVGRHIQESQIC